MIIVTSSREIIECYLFEAYRQVYSNSIDEFGNIGDWDILYENGMKNKIGRQINIPYDDYFCPEDVQDSILVSVCKLPYRIRNYKTIHYLTTYEKRQLRNNFYLGCSPYSSVKGFKKLHPNINNNIFENIEEG